MPGRRGILIIDMWQLMQYNYVRISVEHSLPNVHIEIVKVASGKQ